MGITDVYVHWGFVVVGLVLYGLELWSVISSIHWHDWCNDCCKVWIRLVWNSFCIINICCYFIVTDDSEGTVIHRTDALYGYIVRKCLIELFVMKMSYILVWKLWYVSHGSFLAPHLCNKKSKRIW